MSESEDVLPKKKRKSSSKGSTKEKYSRTSVKKCEKRGCEEFRVHPKCFIQATEKCAIDGFTSRWYHLSPGEHFCNECFEHFYRTSKEGYLVYQQWCDLWSREANTPPNLKMFFVDQFMSYWVQCMLPQCGKWRRLPRHVELHVVDLSTITCTDCDAPEDIHVTHVSSPYWITSLGYSPLLRFTTLAPLVTEYFPEGVGVSPTTVSFSTKRDARDDMVTNLDDDMKSSANDDPFHPFNFPKEGPRARAFTPDVMERFETAAFPEYSRPPEKDAYLLMRNLILALWHDNCTQYLTAEKCSDSLFLRGLVRVWCAGAIHRILYFLTRHGYVNFGILQNPPIPFPLYGCPERKSDVIVIGAGSAGLSAAHHLRNFGYKVTVVEAQGRVGGRVMDDTSFGRCVSLGAMIVTGICNNPIITLCKQLGAPIRVIKEDHCELIHEGTGQLTCDMVDRRVEREYNLTLDKLAEWRRGKPADASLEAKLLELHNNVLAGRVESEEERELFNFHLSNLEFACGAKLDNVSALHWDHNDHHPQFSGHHAFLTNGYSQLLNKLAEQVDVKLNCPVSHVSWSYDDDEVIVTDQSGHDWTCNKVIVTVPLSILKTNGITFEPELPDKKLRAIDKLGAGVIEKVVLKFPFPFWRKKVGDADFFGRVAKAKEDRGLFPMFYDMGKGKPQKSARGSPDMNPDVAILVTVIAGEALNKIQGVSDEDVVEQCMAALKNMFPEHDVPSPVAWKVTGWSKRPYSMMSYSYTAPGASGDHYNILSQDVARTLYFAGEATNRFHPQTVTGAFLSGMREACKIIEHDTEAHYKKPTSGHTSK